MAFQHFRSPTFPIVKQAIESSAIQTVDGARQQLGCARRRAGTRVEQRNFDLPARERGINCRKIADDHSEKSESHPGFPHRQCASNRACWSDVAVAERKKSLAAVVQEQAEIDRLASGS